MTRKHFEAFATELALQRPKVTDTLDMWNQWRRDVEAVAYVLRHSNPRFDSARFRHACETR